MSECECWVTPESTWFVHYGAVEPGSQMEQNPNCPVHPAATVPPPWPAVVVGEIPVRDCFAEMVGMPHYCRLRGDGGCDAAPCREYGQVDQ